MNAQTIITPAGERLVVLPEAEYQALLEAAQDGADTAHVREFRARLAAGEEELLPAALVVRILAGESKVRVWREHRGMTGKALADAAGIAGPTLSQIEKGVRTGTVDVLRRIADALKVDLDDIA